MKTLKGGHKFKEQQNLHRFRSSVNQFLAEHEDSGGKRPRDKKVTQTRKARRKEERKLKKMRISAFKQHQPLPTLSSIKKGKKEKEQEERNHDKAAKRNLLKKEKKQRKRKAKTAKEEIKKQALVDANKQEEKNLKQLEKQLKLNKRKTSNLPKGFLDDGLDFLLDAVNPEKLGHMTDDDDNVLDVWTRPVEDDEDEFDDGSDEDEFDSDEEEDDDDEDDEDDDNRVTSPVSIPLPLASRGILRPSSTANLHAAKSVSFGDGLIKPAKRKADIESEARQEVTRKKAKKVSHDKDAADHDEGHDSDTGNLGDSDDSDSDPGDHSNSGHGDDSDNDPGDDSEGDLGLNTDEECSDDDKNVTEDDGVQEDIYGRLRDSQGNVISTAAPTAYIPPGKKLQMASAPDEKKRIELERMSKQLKGLLNRVSEANLQPISSQIEALFRSHSRAECCQLLAAEVIVAIATPSVAVPERLAMEMLMLVAVVHGNVGSEVGGTLIQSLADKFLECESRCRADPEDKQIDNIVMALAYLYNYKVVHSLLLFDICKRFVESFAEKDIELILLLLRTVGFSLRKDDAAALKVLITDIQTKANVMDSSDANDKSRVKFMLEILLAIKNNNMRKIPNFDPTHMEHLRKLLRNYVHGGGSAESQLRVSLDDLLHADSRGRWWVVGSAWSGRSTDTTPDPVTGSQESALVGRGFSAEILALAQKLRMNTDVRRNIFCVIMTSEDFVAAFEGLLGLGLGLKQERDIVAVLVHLLLTEKKYNPFYSYLAQKLCEYHKRFQVTCQFTVWDQLKELEKKSAYSVTNLAIFLSHLIATGALSLAVFKVVEFADLDRSRVNLMRRVLTSLMVEQPDHVTLDTFRRIAINPKLAVLREGLKLFIGHFLMKKVRDPAASEEWQTRMALVEKALLAGDGRRVT